MARIRTIKPEFPQSETIGRLSRDARLLFVQLFTLVDDEGRARAASRMLASLLYPYDDDAPGCIEGWLRELEKQEAIVRYEVDGSQYLEIVKWLKHQKIDKPSKSRLPPLAEASRLFAKPREGSATDMDLVSVIMDQDQSSPSLCSGETRAQADVRAQESSDDFIEGARKRACREAFEEWYEGYPHKVGRGSAEKSFEKVFRFKLATLDELIDGRDRYVSNKPPDRQWKNPATWLNQKCWLDEPAPVGPAIPADSVKPAFRHAMLTEAFRADEREKQRAQRNMSPPSALITARE